MSGFSNDFTGRGKARHAGSSRQSDGYDGDRGEGVLRLTLCSEGEFGEHTIVCVGVLDSRPRQIVLRCDTDLVRAAARAHRLWMGADAVNERRLGAYCERLASELGTVLFAWIADRIEQASHVEIHLIGDFPAIPVGSMPHFRGRSITWRIDAKAPATDADSRPDIQPLFGRPLQRSRGSATRIDGHGTIEPTNPDASWIEVGGQRVSTAQIDGGNLASGVASMPGHADRGIVLNTCFGSGCDVAVGSALLRSGYDWTLAAVGPIPDDKEIAMALQDFETALEVGLEPAHALRFTHQRCESRNHRRAATVFSLYRPRPQPEDGHLADCRSKACA